MVRANSQEGIMQAREFDLNIEKVLENWDVSHAVREIIANAIDEQTLTSSKDIDISKDVDGNWHIRDFGRGLQYVHLTQNENEEKLKHPGLIGKFGVGLKDALATFDRHNIGVIINSRYGHITVGKSKKHGFSDIMTLHAYIDVALDKNMEGTDFCLAGCKDSDIIAAKNYFLRFANVNFLENTEYGELYDRRNSKSEIFINGIKVAEEENFLFSYNITSLNAALRKALNRERTNVGRSAYSERIRSILLNVKSDYVIDAFTQNLTNMSKGTQCDEMKWVDVQTRAVKLLNARKDTVFVTPEEIKQSSGAVLEIVQKSGKKPIFIPETVKNRISGANDEKGNTISTIETVVSSYNESFKYEFIPYEKLTETEKKQINIIPAVLSLVGSEFPAEKIYVSERLKANTEDDSLGVYDRESKQIVIKRSQLVTRKDFLGTLIHELIHADTGFGDVSRFFESVLTSRIGLLADCYFSLKEQANNAQDFTDYKVKQRELDLAEVSLMTNTELEKLADVFDADEKHQQAIDIYSELIRRDPKNAEYYADRAIIYKTMENYALAEADINVAIGMSNENTSYHAKKGRICALTKDYEIAKQELEYALGLDSDCVEAIIGMVELAHMEDRNDAILVWARKYVDHAPDKTDAYITLCKALYKVGKFDEMRDEATNALAKFPDNAHLYHLRAVAYYSIYESESDYISKYHNISHAVDDAKQACELDSQNMNYQKAYTMLLLKQGGAVPIAL